MLQTPEAINAIMKDAAGLEAKGTCDKTIVREQEAMKTEARRTGMTFHLGSLMSICSIKFAELAKHLQIYKGRLVYRGDCAKDEWGAAALYQERAASPTSVATTNSTIAYGTLPGHSITTADAVKAYAQAHLKSEHPTWVALPPEHWPQDWKDKGYRKPMVRLMQALYGHPESGAHWENHFETSLTPKTSLIILALTGFPKRSCFSPCMLMTSS